MVPKQGTPVEARIRAALDAFATEETFSAVAKRLGMSPNTLRPIWKDAFGEEAFRERGRELQAKAASKTARATAKTRVYKDITVPCSRCRTPHTLKSNQVAQMVGAFVCEACRCDRECPVCGLPVDGPRGLSGHFRHRRDAGDEAHILYEQDTEDARWENLEPEEEYVTCLECGHRAFTLARHLKAAHGFSADAYRAKHGNVLIRARKLTETRSRAIQEGWGADAFLGVKVVECPSCGGEREVSKYFGPIHDARCPTCRAREEESRWEGKTEPEDFVECRLCGWKGLNVMGHIGGHAHPSMELSEYRVRFPEAPLFVEGACQYRAPGNKLSLTETDLEPFKDKKGGVQVALAAYTLGCADITVRIYCKQLGLPTRNRLATQKRVLDTIAELLGEPYAWEWWHPDIVNPETAYHLYYDGRFEHSNLVVEFQGKQHFRFIPYWHQTREQFERCRERDAYKAKRAVEVGLRYLAIRYDEPYDDPAYLQGRLHEVLR